MTLDEAIKTYTSNSEYERTHGNLQGCLDFKQIADWLKELKQLKEQEHCDDAISRQAAIDEIKYELEMINSTLDSMTLDFNARERLRQRRGEARELLNSIQQLPSVTPQPKIGRFIEKDGFDGDTYYECSECGESWTLTAGTPWDNEWYYCPKCGCRMKGEADGK